MEHWKTTLTSFALHLLLWWNELGEIDLRWGILWRPLHFRLKRNVNITDACMCLHNFILDWREEHCEAVVDVDEREIFEEDHKRFMAVYPTFDANATGIHGGEEERTRP